MSLICILVWYDDALCGEIDDSQIQPERPVFYIPNVSADAFFHLPKFLCLSTETCHLCPSCYSWFCKMAYHVLVDDGSIYLCMVQHVWSRTYYAHVSLQNIEKLWKLVDVCLAHEVAKSKLSWVILCGLGCVRILVYMHGAEFVTFENLAVQTCSCLLEE